MLIPDVNLLVYAYNSDAPDHLKARGWWQECMSGTVTIGLPWVVLVGYIRIMTSRRILVRPLPTEAAFRHLRSWLERSQTQVIEPGPNHLDLMESLSLSG